MKQFQMETEFIGDVRMGFCMQCKHFDHAAFEEGYLIKCPAFPKRIPDDISTSFIHNFHTEILPDQVGDLVFEPITGT